MKPQWRIDQPRPADVDTLCRSISCHPVVAAILVNRGFGRVEDADIFLNPSLSRLRPPFPLKDMAAAVRRISRALRNHERILVFGDFDVDGITATAIMVGFLKDAGADVRSHIPHRIDEGYGLSSRYIRSQAMPAGIDLIITVDNGSSSHAAVDQAREMNIDTIIIDHHAIAPPFPAAVAVVNPKRDDCAAGLADLAGVGVVFEVLICLRAHLRETGFWEGRPEPNLKKICDLVALGTVADMVPLRDDNRILTRVGLDIMRQNGIRPGISALLALAGIPPDTVDAEDIAYRLAPRLNAAGRMDHAETALALLTTEEPDTADRLARQIDTLNTQRQKAQKHLISQIETDLKRNTGLLAGRSLVLWGAAWHEGVLGIAAAHFVREYHRPVVLISIRDGIGKGSARSLPGFDLFQGLTECRDMLAGFGGHALAAGIQIEVANLEKFQRRFEAVVDQIAEKKILVPEIRIDCELNLNDISDRLLDELESLTPFGNGNPAPLFLARNVEVVAWKIVGQTHRSMRLRQEALPAGRVSSPGRTFQAIQFNIDPNQTTPRIFKRMAFRVGWNRWHQRLTPRIIIEAVEF